MKVSSAGSGKKHSTVRRSKLPKRYRVGVLLILVTVCLGMVLGSLRHSVRFERFSAPFSPQPQPSIPPPSSPSKEYIYAGGKLIATEEPGNVIPTVTITAPTNNSTFLAGSNLQLVATASDSDGTISKVQFFRGTILLGQATATSGNYTFTWASVPAGTHSVTAQATDNNGAIGTSAPITLISNGAPTVSITGPPNNTVLPAPANFTLTANASDTGGSITKVEFFHGITLIGTDTVAPYSVPWSTVPAGTYSVIAKATDNDGAFTNSAPITLISNGAPTVSITGPPNNTVLPAPANFTLTANASDTGGSITKVEFFHGITLIGTDTVAPYSVPWSTVPAGTYSVFAKATDNDGAFTNSAPITLISNGAPTVSITGPPNNTVLPAPANFTLTANASDTGGSITKVEFFHGITLIGTDTVAPYSVPWSTVPAGTYSVIAKATDNDGAFTNSAPITLISNGAPTVSITGPPNNTVLPAPANFTLTANASDTGGSITKVEFFHGITLIGTDTVAPYSVPWSTVPAGTYSVIAKATDNDGAFTNSAPITLISNGAPTVSITGPPNNTVLPAPANFTLTANASDTGGSITKVEFFHGITLIGTDTVAPYSVPWSTVPAGTYSVIAKATDNDGAFTNSAPITLISNGAPTVSITGPPNNTVLPAPANFTLTANASDTGGSITKVEFFHGITLIGTDTVAPYSVPWSTVPAGTYSVIAKATDNDGAFTNSAPITLISNGAPTVSITGPPNNTVLPAPANFTLTANASDTGGSITKVEFFHGITLIGTDTVAPYSVPWSTVPAGTYSVIAKATDNDGAFTNSAPITLISNGAPTVSITGPPNNTVLPAPANFTLTANASDTGGSITKVEFFHGITLIGTDTVAPYSVPWSTVPAGTYSVFAKATDNNSTVISSSPITLISNATPTVSITSPAHNAMFTPPANITINAIANDVDGAIAKVEFFQGTTLIGTDTATPYTVALNNVGSGSHRLSAVATDDRGASSTSVISVTTPTFFDDFNDNSLDSSKWTIVTPSSPAVVSEQGQQLRITLPSSTATYNGIVSKANYDMRGGTAQVELAQSISQAGSVENFMFLELDAQNQLMIQTGGGNTLFRSRVNGVNDQLIIPFDPAAHRFWRIRHDLNTSSVSFETSPDAILWTSRKTVTSGFSVASLKFYLFAGAFATGNASPGAAVYNDFQYIASPTSLPTLPTFFDDFNDNSLDSMKWTVLAPGAPAVVSEQQQQLRITLPASTAVYNGVVTTGSFDMRGAAVQVQQVQSVSQAGWAENMLKAELDPQNYLLIDTGAGSTLFRSAVNGVNDQLILPYDPVAHRHWRIRHTQSSNSITFETSADGSSWTIRKTATAGFSLASVKFSLIAGAYGTGNAAPGAAIYDDFQFTGTASLPPSIISEDFNDNSLDASKWNADNLFSGFTSMSVPISETAQRLEIGPLLQGTADSNYRGIRTVNTFSLAGAYAYVELVQAPSSTTDADAMFTVGNNADNYYRIYVSGGNLIGLRRIGGTKTTLFTIPFDPTNHRFLRIRHNAGGLTMDTAPGNGGIPGAWVQRYGEMWSGAVSITSIIFEVKGGTSKAEANAPGKVIFDNFRVAANGS